MKNLLSVGDEPTWPILSALCGVFVQVTQLLEVLHMGSCDAMS